MKLELKHLAAYLPYKIKVLHTEWSENCESEIVNIECVCDEYVTFSGNNTSDWYFDNEENECEFKFILRPLSDLTKEIEVNGEKFTPIIYLAKIQYPNVDFEIIENECIGRLNAGVVLEFYIDDEIPFYKEYHNNIFGQRKGNDFDDMFLSNMKPSELRYKLFEWHFDIFGLIENGLAIDINTLK